MLRVRWFSSGICTGHRTQGTGHSTQDTGHRTQDYGWGGNEHVEMTVGSLAPGICKRRGQFIRRSANRMKSSVCPPTPPAGSSGSADIATGAQEVSPISVKAGKAALQLTGIVPLLPNCTTSSP
jgi:hypothetical protein